MDIGRQTEVWCEKIIKRVDYEGDVERDKVTLGEMELKECEW